MSNTAALISSLLEDATLTYTDEDQLQTALAEVLLGAGLSCVREVRLSDGRSRIDLKIENTPTDAEPWVGIEVKIKGSTTEVVRQLTRYAACPEISELILITTRAKHHGIRRELNGKPVHLLSLVEAGL